MAWARACCWPTRPTCGGTQGSLWTQVVSDITGREQEVREQSIEAATAVRCWQPGW